MNKLHWQEGLEARRRSVTAVLVGLDPATKKILPDFSKAPYLNSSGIALAIQLLVAPGKASQKVVCFGLSAHFSKVFTMLGLAKYTSLHPDEAEARKAVA